jgi:hypothetical protein
MVRISLFYSVWTESVAYAATYTIGIAPAVKRQGSEADRSAPTLAEVK